MANRNIPSDIENKLIQLIVSTLSIPPNKVKLDSKLIDDLGVDSLGAVEIEFAIKQNFKVDFQNIDFKKIETVRDVALCIKNSSSKRKK